MLHSDGLKPTTVEERKAIKEWEEYVSEGIEVRESKDNTQWRLGDLAAGIKKDYGEDSIGKFAYAIGSTRKTLMNYRTVAETFEVGTRSNYRKLSFSHFAVLTATKKPKAWLEKADDNDWSVEHLRVELKQAYEPIKAPKLTDDPPAVYKCDSCGLWRLRDMSSFDICRGHYVLKDGQEYYE